MDHRFDAFMRSLGVTQVWQLDILRALACAPRNALVLRRETRHSTFRQAEAEYIARAKELT